MRMVDDVADFLEGKSQHLKTAWLDKRILTETHMGFSYDYIDHTLLISDDCSDGNGHLALQLIQQWLQHEELKIPVNAELTDARSGDKAYYQISQSHIVCDQSPPAQNAPSP